jgi:hypothetical protein
MAKALAAPERLIFKYHDGSKERSADPMLVFRAMLAHPTFELEKHIDELIADDPHIQSEASKLAVQATRDILGIKAWSEDNPDGLTELDTLAVLASFVAFTEQLKKNGRGQPT